METYFSVGEISKLTNVPIQTLRYYDKMGLLKPAYINEQNNYRYYSVNQFIKIDLLKQCKLIGLSLKEIEELLKNEISADSMLKLIDQQRKVLDDKIKELEAVKSYINFLGDRLKETKEIEENKINNLRYYKMMLEYINKYNIETIGNFNEFSILSRVNSKEAEKSIIQLEIKIK